MRHRAALAGAALATAVFALIGGPGSAATVGIPPTLDSGCCSISGSNLQDDPATAGGEAADPSTPNDAATDGSEKSADLLEPNAVAITDGGGLDANAPDVVSSVVAPEPVLTRLLLIFADLRAAVLGSP